MEDNYFTYKLYDKIKRDIPVSTYKVNEVFNPIINKLNSSIKLSTFVIALENIFYEVIEGIYNVTDNQMSLKLKVKKDG